MGYYFPVLAATPVNQVVPVLAFYTFLRTFVNVWGVTVGGVVLQNKLIHGLPQKFLDSFPQGVEIAFAAIPGISDLDPALEDEVRAVFARSLSTLWKIMTGIAGIGLLVSLAMKRFPLHTSVDEEWGQKDQSEKQEVKVEVSDVTQR
ncbi:hypothetical protein BC834DRAFT_970527 [Gloeopeniophorella convolvens]|nr:hypothetical protein BC834DRAFT_970527 [Gloeopeniophorella convolvens]